MITLTGSFPPPSPRPHSLAAAASDRFAARRKGGERIDGETKTQVPPAGWQCWIAALLLAALVAMPGSGVALAQSPPPHTGGDNLSLVNRDRQMVERKKDGEFVARPVFSRRIDVLHYALRHPDTGEWVTNTYRVRGGEKQLTEGWEYTFEYPVLDGQPELHPEQAFLMVLSVPRRGGGENHVFHALVPVHQPKGLWDKVLGALDPDRWARAGAAWVIQGVHGTLCGVVEKVADSDLAECGG